MERQRVLDWSWLGGGAVVVSLGALLIAEGAVQAATSSTIFGAEVNPAVAVAVGFAVAVLGGTIIGEAGRSRRPLAGFPSNMTLAVFNGLLGGVLIGVGGVLIAIIPQVVFNGLAEAALLISGTGLFVRGFVRTKRRVE